MVTRPKQASRSKGGGGGGSVWGLIVGATILVVVVVAGIVLFQLFNEEPSAGPEVAAEISDITDDPYEYYGSTVTVSGEVGEIIDPRAFTIGTQDELVGGNLLVVGAQELPQIIEGDANEISAQDVAQVTGPVREFDITEIEEEIGANLEPRLFSEFEGGPVVVADKVDLTPEASGGQNVQATLTDITDYPAEYYGQSLMVEGAVDQTIEPNVFAIVPLQSAGNETLYREPSAPVKELGVLVVSSNSSPNLTEDQIVRVSGTFREFDLTTFENELGVDLNDELYTDWTGQPAILAQQVQTQ